MVKLKLSSSFNDDEENYFKLKIQNPTDEIYIKELNALLDELKISYLLDIGPCESPLKYKSWVGKHNFFRTKAYIVHLIFSSDYLHLIIKCDLKTRAQLMKILKKHCVF